MLGLLGLMQRRMWMSGPELARSLGIDVRELRREIERLDALNLGMRLERCRGRRGGYSLARGDAMPPLVISDGEALAIVVALRRMRRQADPRSLARSERETVALAGRARIAEELQYSADLALSRIERLLPAPMLTRRGLAQSSLDAVADRIEVRNQGQDVDETPLRGAGL